MDKKRLKTAIKVLNEVKTEYLQEFIDDLLEQMCRKENMSVEEVIFRFTCLEAKR